MTSLTINNAKKTFRYKPKYYVLEYHGLNDCE